MRYTVLSDCYHNQFSRVISVADDDSDCDSDDELIDLGSASCKPPLEDSTAAHSDAQRPGVPLQDAVRLP